MMGASAAILAKGFTLDCLMMRYQRVDWRDQDNWGCNARCAAPRTRAWRCPPTRPMPACSTTWLSLWGCSRGLEQPGPA